MSTSSKHFRKLRGLPLVGRVADWGMGPHAASKKTKRAGARIAGLKATESVCPYCAVGCGQVVYTRDGELIDIEGNPRSPINQGTLCPKGSASRQLVQQNFLRVVQQAVLDTGLRPADLRVEITEGGRRVVNLRVPLNMASLAAGFVPGLPDDTAERVRSAIRAGERGPIVDITTDDGDRVLIVNE